jgi:hypothetical protein
MTFAFDPVLHEFKQEGVVIPSVTQVLAKAGICDYSFVSEEMREYSMKRGTSVHWMLQLEDEGALNYRKVPSSLRGYRRAYQTWKKRSLFHPLMIEHQFVSNFGFAGIVDRAGTFPSVAVLGRGSSAIVDIKTGDVPDWARYQLAAYCVGIEPQLALARYLRRIAIRLRPDGTYKVKEFPLCTWDVDFSKFMHALEKANGSSRSNAAAGNRTQAAGVDGHRTVEVG